MSFCIFTFEIFVFRWLWCRTSLFPLYYHILILHHIFPTGHTASVPILPVLSQSALLVLWRMAADELRRSQLATAFWFCDCDKENNFCHQELLFFPPIWSARALKNMEAMTEYRTTPHRAPANQNSVPIAFGHRPSAAAQLIECLKENEWQKRERNPDFVYKTLC